MHAQQGFLSRQQKDAEEITEHFPALAGKYGEKQQRKHYFNRRNGKRKWSNFSDNAQNRLMLFQIWFAKKDTKQFESQLSW